MYVPGAIKRVLKKANLNKQKAVAKDQEEFHKGNPIVSVDTKDGIKTLTYEDGSSSTYEVEQVFSGTLKSKHPTEVSWEVLISAGSENDFENLSKEEFNKLWESGDVGSYEQHDMPEQVTTVEDANIVTSLVDGKEKTHAAVLDFDFPHVYVPSSTPGHGHLYIDMEWDQETFFLFMEMLVDFGLLEKGYYQASKARGYSAVRLPHIKKEVIDG